MLVRHTCKIWWIWISKLKWPSPIELFHTNTKHQRSIHTKILYTTKGENFHLKLNIFILTKHGYLGSDVQKELYQWEFYKTLPTLGVDECVQSHFENAPKIGSFELIFFLNLWNESTWKFSSTTALRKLFWRERSKH